MYSDMKYVYMHLISFMTEFGPLKLSFGVLFRDTLKYVEEYHTSFYVNEGIFIIIIVL